ncbi:MAG TPA: cell division protein ZapA [Polyangiaceae bacterium]|nr:cell division protein ZapA [Polyangiaceae bacterium]
MARTVELRIAGQSYRVVSSASAEELERLAAVVNRKMNELAPHGRVDGSQRLLLVALALAHDVEEERGHREALWNRTREFLGQLLGRVDAALANPLVLGAAVGAVGTGMGEGGMGVAPGGGASDAHLGKSDAHLGKIEPGEERFT